MDIIRQTDEGLPHRDLPGAHSNLKKARSRAPGPVLRLGAGSDEQYREDG